MAKLLQLSTRTLRSLRAKGKISFVRLTPRTIRYADSDIADFIERHTVMERPPRPTSNVTSRVSRPNQARLQAEYENVFRRGKQPKK